MVPGTPVSPGSGIPGITGGQLGCLGLLLVASEPLEGTGGERAVAGRSVLGRRAAKNWRLLLPPMGGLRLLGIHTPNPCHTHNTS